MIKINKNEIRNYILILAGNILISLAFGAFLIPSNIVTGGMSGIAVIFHNTLKISPSLLVLILSWSFFACGFFVFGKSFALKTLLTTIIFPLGVIVTEHWDWLLNQTIQMETWIICITAALLCGTGTAFVFKAGGSTGGIDILAYIIRVKFKKFEITTYILMIDAIIIGSGLIALNLNSVIIGLIFTLFSKLVTDRVMLGGINNILVQIISSEIDPILDFIHKNLKRGSTLISARGGYTKNESPIIQVLINKNQFDDLRNKIKSIDSKAFIVIINANDVLGHGFNDITKY